jgi:hypothetical protein
MTFNMEQKDNTLLWIAIFGLAYWIWYTRRQLIAEGGPLPPVPLIPGTTMMATLPVQQVTSTPIVTPGIPVTSNAQTVQPAQMVPVTIQSNKVNGFQTSPGRFGAIASCEP